jgi:hypothetical protein
MRFKYHLGIHADSPACANTSGNGTGKSTLLRLTVMYGDLGSLLSQDAVRRRAAHRSSRLAQPAMIGKLWDLLRSGKDGLGKAITSKLIAAKRLKLIPIWDSFVKHGTGLGTKDYWRHFQTVLLADDKQIWNWLNGLRDDVVGLPQAVPTLRILDVVLWMLGDTKAA